MNPTESDGIRHPAGGGKPPVDNELRYRRNIMLISQLLRSRGGSLEREKALISGLSAENNKLQQQKTGKTAKKIACGADLLR